MNVFPLIFPILVFHLDFSCSLSSTVVIVHTTQIQPISLTQSNSQMSILLVGVVTGLGIWLVDCYAFMVYFLTLNVFFLPCKFCFYSTFWLNMSVHIVISHYPSCKHFLYFLIFLFCAH